MRLVIRRICSLTALGLLFMAIAAIMANEARADLFTTLTVSVNWQADGNYMYEYTLENLSSSDVTVGGLSIDVSADADLTSIIAPVGWNEIYTSGDEAITWESPMKSLDILPGQTAVFSFLSRLPSQLQFYEIDGYGTPPDIESNEGFIASPGAAVAVAEPSGLFLLSGMTSMAVMLAQVRSTAKTRRRLGLTRLQSCDHGQGIEC